MLTKSILWRKGFTSAHRLYSSSLREVKKGTPGRNLEPATEAETMKKHFTAYVIFIACYLHFYTTQYHLPKDDTAHSWALSHQLATKNMAQRHVIVQSCRSRISVEGPSSQVTLASSHMVNRRKSHILWLNLYDIQSRQICSDNQ